MAEAIPSPNIWGDPDGYEIENAGVDPDGAIETAMSRVLADHGRPDGWSGLDVLDVGCGTGYHLPRWAATAATVTGVEPHGPLVIRARERVEALGHDPSRVQVVEAGAESIPLPDSSIDMSQARWAYFFGAGSEPGLAELSRVMRPGGVSFVIDNDATRSTFGEWFRRAWPTYDPLAVERWWRRQGWSVERVDMRWQHQSREDFERVVRMEFTPGMSDWILQEHKDIQVDYAVNLWWRSW